jgi:putative restriction endonuclease
VGRHGDAGNAALMALNIDEQDALRDALFTAASRYIDAKGGYASRNELVEFRFAGEQFGLIDSTRGIRNPRVFDETLSIVSSHDGPYEDHVAADGLFRYSFAPGGLREGDNRKLLAAMTRRVPIILFEKPMPNVYVPVMPAYVVDVDETRRFFVIATTDASLRSRDLADAGWIEKRYVEQTVRQRVHQPVFRAQILTAYARTCAICRLKHAELLDAAHIIPDAHSDGVAAITNGLALCKIHHSAYDQQLIGIDADYRVHVDAELLAEVDGPMLAHGFQAMHGMMLTTPTKREWLPSRDGLASRFEEFAARR